MKTILFGVAIVAASFSACSNNNNGSKTTDTNRSDTTQTNTQTSNTTTEQTTSVNEAVSAYLQLKNALANDNGNAAANAAKQLTQAMAKLDHASFNTEQKKVYDDVKDDIKENAEHISTNGGKIEHQREHFDMLSKDMYDLVKAFKPGQTLYKDHCPMYNDNKGADWLSEVKEIKNPYLGKKMPDCGEVKEEIKQ
jgi:hypothetical protein